MSAGVVVDSKVLSWLFDQRTSAVRDRYRTLNGAPAIGWLNSTAGVG